MAWFDYDAGHAVVKSPDHEIVGKTKAIAIALKGESRRRRRRRVLICVAYHLLPERESHHSVIK